MFKSNKTITAMPHFIAVETVKSRVETTGMITPFFSPGKL